jgi:hypothetical protein
VSKDDIKAKREILRKELGDRGLVIRLSTSREGENLIARLEVTEAATDRTVAKLVSVAKVDDLNLVVGVDAPEGMARDFLAQLFGFAEALRELVPGVMVHEEAPGHYD